MPAHWQLTQGYLIGPEANLSRASLTDADLTKAFLYRAKLIDADLTDATFGFNTILFSGQTVLQHGFDTAGLQTYLEASHIGANNASNLKLLPEPSTLLLGLLALTAVRLRVRHG